MKHAKLFVMLTGAVLFSSAVIADDESSNEAGEAQLRAARAKLEEAAHEVAELSARLGKPLVERLLMMGDGAGHAVIGVQLDAADSKGGAHVSDVTANGPAAVAGIHSGDVIVAVSGTDVRGAHPAAEVARLMRAVQPNSKIKLKLLREGRTFEVEVTARGVEGARDSQNATQPVPGTPVIAGSMQGSLAGMELVSLTRQLGAYFGTDRGVLVLRAPRSAAFSLQDGDVIVSIDGDAPGSGAQAMHSLASHQPGEKIKLGVMRQHKKMSLEVQLSEHR